MIKHLLFTFLATWFSTSAYSSVVEIDLVGKLEMIQEYESDPVKRLTAKYNIIRLMTQCEFDEACELNTQDALEGFYNQEKNIMYKAFLKYLTWEKKNLEYNIQNCQLDEKKLVRKFYAQCYENWIETQMRHQMDRQAMDINDDNRYRCIKEKGESLALQGNIFAQAALVNVAEHFNELQEMSQWVNKIENAKGTSSYEHYMKCSELP
ncbi:MAG: hypothetical protein JSS07_04305 [Proteobacteria bacterium]|nr:hypothetical protein [Pseudomonadota bacterium]